MPRPPAEFSARPFLLPAWASIACLLAVVTLALVALNLRLGQKHLRLRLDIAEQETLLLRAELHAARNQLEAERLLAAAQNRHWHAKTLTEPDASHAPRLPSSAP
jgi:hypothetical protein